MRRLPATVRALVFGVVSVGAAHADCPPTWLYGPESGLPGLDRWGAALVAWDDGAGPALYVGGDFDVAGDAYAESIAKWDGHTWQAVGGGVEMGEVYALTVYHNELIAAGSFATAGDGLPCRCIAAWDGHDWRPLDAGLGGAAYALTVFNGELIVGGQFRAASGVWCFSQSSLCPRALAMSRLVIGYFWRHR